MWVHVNASVTDLFPMFAEVDVAGWQRQLPMVAEAGIGKWRRQLPMAAEQNAPAGVGGETETLHKQKRQLAAAAAGH